VVNSQSSRSAAQSSDQTDTGYRLADAVQEVDGSSNCNPLSVQDF